MRFTGYMYLLSLATNGCAVPTLQNLSEISSSEVECNYYEGEFTVNLDGISYRKYVDDFANTAMSCGSDIAALYDGDDVYIFDTQSRSFDRYGMPDDDVTNSAIIAEYGSVLFYDSDDIYYYCNGRWNRDGFIDDGLTVSTFLDFENRKLVIRTEDYNYSLDSNNCTLDRNSGGGEIGCSYEDGTFEVNVGGQSYREYVDTYSFAKVSCGMNVSALYDGDDIYVFDHKNRSFHRNGMCDDGFETASVIAGADVALVYDGDDIYAYCGSNTWDRSGRPDDNSLSYSSGSGTSNLVSISVGDDSFTVNKNNCDIEYN